MVNGVQLEVSKSNLIALRYAKHATSGAHLDSATGLENSHTVIHAPSTLARRYMSSKSSPGLYTRLLIYSAFQVAFISFLLSYYNVQPLSYLSRRIRESQVWDHSVDALRDFLEPIKEIYDDVVDLIDVYDDDDDELTPNPRKSRKRREVKKESEVKKVAENSEKVDISKLPVLTREQLTLFDGSRPSKDVYLALLGRIYNVQKGSKYYAPGGSYHFFAGKDATRAFVTGDFSESGLTDDVRGLSEEDLLGIAEWSSFYEKNYELVGLLQGTYYDAKGKPTPRLQEVKKLTEKANEWKKAQAKENEIFPPCNSEWHKDSGRVWCSAKRFLSDYHKAIIYIMEKNVVLYFLAIFIFS